MAFDREISNCSNLPENELTHRHATYLSVIRLNAKREQIGPVLHGPKSKIHSNLPFFANFKSQPTYPCKFPHIAVDAVGVGLGRLFLLDHIPKQSILVAYLSVVMFLLYRCPLRCSSQPKQQKCSRCQDFSSANVYSRAKIS